MREFWKGNKWIVIFLGITVVYSIHYIIVNDKETILSMLYAVSPSYIAAFIFYLFQIYFPEKKRIKIVNRVLKSRLNSIITRIDKMYFELDKLYFQNSNDNENVNRFDQIQKRFSLNDITSISNINNIRSIYEIGNKENKMMMRQLLYNTLYEVKDSIDFLYKTFPNYLSNEIIEALESIKNSEFIRQFSIFLQMRPEMDLNISINDHNLFEDFWNLNCELVKCKDEIN